jgi:hypothetical protein
VADIIKSWPASIHAADIADMFTDDAKYSAYYFTIGRGKPKEKIERIWWSYQGRIIGSFKVDRLVINDGTLPQLGSISGGDEWSIKPDRWVAICESGGEPLKERLFFAGFRGWRYFDIESYRNTPESKVRL